MKASAAKRNIVEVVLLAGVFPWILGWAAKFLFGSSARVHELPHTYLELTGACIALAVAMLLWVRAQWEQESSHVMWVAAGLVAMGLLEGVHAGTGFGVPWSWLRHTATFAGGMFFALDGVQYATEAAVTSKMRI